MSASTTHPWARPEDEAWGNRLAHQLAMTHSVPTDLVDDVLGEAREACAVSSRSAVEIFGEADAYARDVLRERVPVADRARLDLDGGSPRDRRSVLLLTSGSSAAIISILTLAREGWWTEVDPAEIAVFLGVVAAWVGGLWGALDRKAGYLRRGWSWWAGAAAALGGAIAMAMTLRDQPPLGRIPVILLLLASITVVVLGATTSTGTTPATDDSEDLNPQEWFDRLTGLLRGRYYLPRAAARRQVAEAHSHWHDSGSAHPRDQFGTPEVYALELLDGAPEPATGRQLAKAGAMTAFAAWWVFSTTTSVLDGDALWEILVKGTLVLVTTGLAVEAWRQGQGQGRIRRPSD